MSRSTWLTTSDHSAPSEAVTWHELECGRYDADLDLWLGLAAATEGPVLEIGAGTGRVSGCLAAARHDVVALEIDPVLLAELASRHPAVSPVLADARDFHLQRRFALIVVPMQTVQLLGGPGGRRRFLRCARRHLSAGGVLATAIVDELPGFAAADGGALPPADVHERHGTVFESQPTAIRISVHAIELERRRRALTPSGGAYEELDAVALDRVKPDDLRAEGERAGLRGLAHREIASTSEHVSSTVVMWHG
ncbi:MAG: class I SAM-dependent methyltransferase [Solirubrobacteraceae bacterium]|nr:MAG: hypothetical protein DLM63_12510 [Solirubrobacterales bacterium]